MSTGVGVPSPRSYVSAGENDGGDWVYTITPDPGRGFFLYTIGIAADVDGSPTAVTVEVGGIIVAEILAPQGNAEPDKFDLGAGVAFPINAAVTVRISPGTAGTFYITAGEYV